MDIDDGAFLDAVTEVAEAEERRQQKHERKERKRARREAKRARKEAKRARKEAKRARKEAKATAAEDQQQQQQQKKKSAASSAAQSSEQKKSAASNAAQSNEQKKSAASSAAQSSDDSQTYSSDSSTSSNNEPKKQQRTVRSYGPDASSWRMYEKARAEFLQKKLTAGGQVPAHVRDPKLISTLRRPYIPGAGRRSTYGLVRSILGGTVSTGTTIGTATMTISVARGRGRLRGRGGRATHRFFPPRPKADYLDERGQIDKRKLLEIATENATKLAMEGKLPKGAELVDTIKIKSVEQLATLCKQVAEEEATRPVPFTKWINPGFALGGAGGVPLAKRTFRPAGRVDNDDDYLLLQKVSSGSEEEEDEEERFQRCHESWKRRTQKAKETSYEEAEGGDGTTPFKKPLRLLSSEIKIKIAGSTQKSMSWLKPGKAAPPPLVAPPPTASSDTPSTSAAAEMQLSVPMLAAALVRPLPKPPVPPVFSPVSSLLPPPPAPPKLTPPPPKAPLLIRPLPQPPKPPVFVPKQQQQPQQSSNKDSEEPSLSAESGQ